MRIIILLTLFLSFTALHAEESVPAKPVTLAVQSFKNGADEYLVLSFENFPHWHTYWKNPGDAGLAVKNVFTIAGKEIKLEEVEWPAPRRFIEPGNLWAYGYEGGYTFFFKLSKKDFNKFSGKIIDLKSTWLVCKHICVPGQQLSQFKIAPGKVMTATPDLHADYDSTLLAERFHALPKLSVMPEYLNIKLAKGKTPGTIVLLYSVSKTTDVTFLKDTNLLYAFPQLPFDVKHENLEVTKTDIKGSMEISWDGEYQTPPEPLSADGKFTKPKNLRFLFSDPIQKKVLLIEKKFTSFDLAEVTVVAKPEGAAPVDMGGASDTSSKIVNAANRSIGYYLVLAFIGGLILNIMPCVLPVISIKLFGLVKYKNESHKAIIKHNVFYTLGILFTFLTLATIVLSLKSIGSQVGWGFQLQSPSFISIMIIGLFVFALNLFGVFEFATPGGSTLGNVTTKKNFTGDFLSGILATVLSTPCSAPFLGTALTFAFTSSTMEIYLIFTMIGLGLAFPFILTAIYPRLVAFLPKPGNWMNTVKKILGATLLLTIIWLLDVYNALVDGSSHLIKLGGILVFIYTGFLLLRKKEKWIGAVSFLIGLGIFVNIATTNVVASRDDQTALIRDKQAQGLDWQVWSESKMSEYKTNQEVVFIDFTAKWCFTCKVNEKLVLDTADFKNLVKDYNLKLLIGDWTKRDEVIGSFLRKNGLVGVPAYFIQKKDGTVINLGETVSLRRIKEQLN
ncbi:MAG: thioredoxin family protein [Bacteriovorax sp.]|nr:thioredoxin family protein [Bacteriovorax sp.]